MINVMWDITVGVSENPYITSRMDLDLRIKYNECILRGPVLKKILQVLLESKEWENWLAGDQWSLSLEKKFAM